MLIFLDTEYTDEHWRELISVGMVSEDGQRWIYFERTDYPQKLCSRFVQLHVEPHLGTDPSQACAQPELTQRLREWFHTLPRSVQLASDSSVDRDLLLAAIGGVMPANVSPVLYDLRPLIDTAVYDKAVERYHAHPDHPWHHALHDALAHRAGWLAWIDLNRARKA